MTGGDIPIGDFTYPVTSDLSAKQFWAVYLTSTTLAVCPTGNYGCLGILQDNPNGSTKATVGAVRELGHSKAWIYYAAGTVVAGSPLRVSTTTPGKLELGSVGTDVIVAIACEAASTAADSIIEVALTARTAQGTSSRSGHLVFNIPIVKLRTTGNIYAAMDLGFAGAVTDMFAVVNSACSATTSATAAIDLLMGASGTTQMTGLTIPVANLTAAACNTFGSVIAGSGTAAANTFISTDKLTIHVTQGSTQFGSGDTGTIELHIVAT